MRIKNNEILDILQKWEWAFGQRSSREQWSNKSKEEQDNDIDEFRRELNKVVMFAMNKEEKE